MERKKIGPGFPSPICLLFTSRIGTISAAVPVKKTSSALNSWYGVMLDSVTSAPSFVASLAVTWAVIPGNAPLQTGGVNSLPFLTMKMFSPTPSATKPFLSRHMASSAPAELASIFAMTLLR